MTTIITFAALILGFVPMIGMVAVIMTVLWLAYQLSPKFATMFDNFFDMIFGVNENDDVYEETEFVIHPANYIKVPSSR